MPNGYGAVVYLGKGRRKPYAARKTVGWKWVNGKAVQDYKYIGYYMTQEEALSALVGINDKRIDVKKIDVTFEFLYEEWFGLHTQGKSDALKNSLKCGYNYLDSIKEKKAVDISDRMLQEILDQCEKSYAVKQTIRQVMQGVMTLAQSKGIRGDNPSAILNIGKQPKSDAHKAFTKEDWEKIMQSEDAKAILFMSYTGMRINEVLGLKVKNIHLDERYLIGGLKSEAGKDRVIPIHKSQIEFLREQMQGKRTYLFEFKGKKMTYEYFRDHHWNDVLDACQTAERYTPHDSRHTFITNMRNVGANLLVTQKIVGHTPREITERVYTHVTLEEMIEAIDLLP